MQDTVMRRVVKSVARQLAWLCVLPSLVSYRLRASIIGRDRALEGSTQLLSLLPGLPGQYLRRAFLTDAIAYCDPTATICIGTVFSQSSAHISERVYIGPGCYVGRVRLEVGCLVGAGVHLTSGRHTHGDVTTTTSLHDEPIQRHLITIGANTWIGSGAIVMANVGRDAVIGAGAVVTKPVPDGVIAAGVPAKIVRRRGPETPDRTSSGTSL